MTKGHSGHERHSSREGVHTNDRSHETNEIKLATDKRAGEYDVIRGKHEKTQLGDNSLRDNAELTPKQQTTELTTTRGRTTETDTPRESSEATQEHHNRHEVTTDHDATQTSTPHEVTESPAKTHDTIEPTHSKEETEKGNDEKSAVEKRIDELETSMKKGRDRLGIMNVIGALTQGERELAQKSAGTVKDGTE